MTKRRYGKNAQADEIDEQSAAIDEGPSKSSLKREMQALQELGAQLVALSPERLARVPLPEQLLEAIRDARRFTKHEARRRQLQYIGRLMRHVDAEPIQAALDAFADGSRAATARHHRLERLRADFIDDESAIEAILALWPHADVQHLRTLRRNALKEQSQARPPRAYRMIFKILRELDEGADATKPAADGEENA